MIYNENKNASNEKGPLLIQKYTIFKTQKIAIP